MNIAKDCEVFKAIKGYTRLYKATQIYTRLHKATQGLHKSIFINDKKPIHSYYKPYIPLNLYSDYVHNIYTFITTMQGYSRLFKSIQCHSRLKQASHSSLGNVLHVSRINNPTLLPINNPALLHF